AEGFSPWYLPGATVRHFVPSRKCTLSHIAARSEADGFYQASKHAKELDGPRILGIPRWMYRETVSRALTYCRARVVGRSGIREYVNLRQTIGAMKAFRQLRKDRERASNYGIAVTR
ncbi:MAG: hypothetical protein ACRD1X_09505, partial [Vicinamibacteria bacterium]